jgi:hypothetical protein
MSHETIIHFTAKVTNQSSPHPEKKKKKKTIIQLMLLNKSPIASAKATATTLKTAKAQKPSTYTIQ